MDRCRAAGREGSLSLRSFDHAPAVAALDAAGALALCTWEVREGDASLRSASPAFAALVGEAAEGATWSSIFGRAATFPTGASSAEYTVVDADGRMSVVLLTTVGAADPGVFVSLAVDVTEQARLRRDAEQASQAKSRFLGVVSHELRSPLNIINGQVELLREGVYGRLADQAVQVLESVHRAERKLKGIIDEVLTFSRVEMGLVAYDVQPLLLEPMLRGVVAATASQCRAKRQVVELILPAGPVTMLADEEKLQGALLAIASNASKFTPPEGRIVIDTAIRPGMADFIFIRITDTGVGVPPDHWESVFSPFAQVDERRARSAEGLGLGLTIARDVMRGMGGDVRVRSRAGEGATFTVAIRREVTPPT